MHAKDTTEPSPFAHELLNGKPYTYLDDAPLEERRTRAVSLRRSLPEHQRDLGELDLAAIERVRDDALAGGSGCGRAARPAVAADGGACRLRSGRSRPRPYMTNSSRPAARLRSRRMRRALVRGGEPARDRGAVSGRACDADGDAAGASRCPAAGARGAGAGGGARAHGVPGAGDGGVARGDACAA